MATRRRLIALGAGLAPGLTLAACSGAARTSPAPSETRTRPAVAMEYWSRWPQPAPTEIEEKRVGEWNAANAPTTFTRTGMVGDYIEKLNTAFAAGTGPDTYTVGGSGVPNFSAKGAALSGIDRYQAVQKELPDFFPATVEAARYQGKLNGLPYIVDIRNMIVRKDHMQQAGLDTATFPETWDRFREAARRMTQRNGTDFAVVGFGMPKASWGAHDLWFTLVQQQNAYPFNQELTRTQFTTAEARAALQLMVDLLNKDQVDTLKPPAPPSGQHALVAGLQACTWDSAGPVNAARRAAPDQMANIITAPIPMLKKRVTYMGGTLLMASNKPKDADAAVDFMVYLTAARHAEEINSVQNAVPPRKSARDLPYVMDPLIKTFYDAVGYGWTYPNHAHYTEIRDVIVKEIEPAMKLEKSVQAALDDAARGVQEYLDRR
ncbi:MAG TPA: extracellular solute-binding protein [Chloroflexota bacterium]|nr:extracellular solute-binding protein [Chloroflexota bacterium]